jgi:hypothetical protein
MPQGGPVGPRCAHAEQVPHQQSEIQRPGLQQISDSTAHKKDARQSSVDRLSQSISSIDANLDYVFPLPCAAIYYTCFILATKKSTLFSARVWTFTTGC